MELTPIDVQQKTFRASLRGYDEHEVDEFLDQVVETLHAYQQRLQEAEERVVALEEELAATRETEEAIKRTFIAAQRTRDEMVEEAREEAARILAEAKENAEEHLAEARLRAVRLEEERLRERDELVREVTLLREAVTDVKSRLRVLASGALEQLEEAEEILEEVELPEEEPAEAWGEDQAIEEAEVLYAEEERFRDVGLADEEEAAEEPMAAGASYLRRPRPRRPWERDES